MNYKNSPISKVKFRNKIIYVKRDDLLHKDFSGNKARKFFYFLEKDFTNINKIISFGSAQANSLYSLSVLAKIKNVKLDFYVNHISSFLKQNPQGNYKASLENGANIIEKEDVEDLKDYIEQNLLNDETIFIEEGGRVKEAEFGIKILANEIIKWTEENFKNDLEKLNTLKIMLPSGTGTTALFLQKNLPFEVLTVPCVSDAKYLEKQFYSLENNKKYHPKVIEISQKYHFGKLYKEFYETWLEVKNETKIEFDLLYDPLGFLSLGSSKFFDENIILYIHQGGLLGNETMLERYKRKYQ